MHAPIAIARAAAMLAAACLASHVQAAEADYHVHYTIAVSDGAYASTTVTVGAPNGPALVRPAGACGLRFEYPDDADWIIPVYDDEDTRTSGHINVWLPSKDCSAWNNVLIEPDNEDDDDITAAPHGVPGTLFVAGAKAYWIDTQGKKLVHKHCCGKDYVYGHEVAESIAGSSAGLQAVKYALHGTASAEAVFEALGASERALRALGHHLQSSVAQRRLLPSGRLEHSVRGLEDAAGTLVGDALLAHQTCADAAARADTAAALMACDVGLDSVERARAALATVDAWLR